jgi:hypothetical protein
MYESGRGLERNDRKKERQKDRKTNEGFYIINAKISFNWNIEFCSYTMRIFLILLICVNIFKPIYALEDLSNNGSSSLKNGNSIVIMQPNILSAEIVPLFTPNSVYGGRIGGRLIYPNSPCQTSCNSQST